MFSVIFEVHPRREQWDAYLDNAKMLRPELVQVDGFIDIRYKSLAREGWILSLSGWRDEKAVVRWRTKMRHHMVQEKGRSEILLDYHLRVGQITQDNLHQVLSASPGPPCLKRTRSTPSPVR
jgi:heme-degrading monooxygenase HmoA